MEGEKTLKKCVFVTGNKKKLAEAQSILKDVVELTNISIDLPELQGDEKEIAIAKVREAYK